MKMDVLNLTEDNFNELTLKDGIVMIDCWAEWCGACKTFNPVYERIAERYPDHTFVKLNTAIEKNLVEELGIKNIPTLMLFRDGVLLFQQPGYYEEDKLEDIIKQADTLDMDEVRAQIAAEGKGK